MNPLDRVCGKPIKNVIGLMSGTSADGVDAALVEIAGCGTDTRAQLRAFLTVPFDRALRERILTLAKGDAGGSEELCLMNVLLGKRYAQACLALCEKAGVKPGEIDLIGSHGQTLYHIPQAMNYLGEETRGTLQLGDPSYLNEAFSCPVVSDFRARDMAAGGQGAPLVPYTEYLLYRSVRENIALLNIGGIGNITLLPRGCALNDVVAFDTGPGNMVMDALIYRMSGGWLTYDAGGETAAKGAVSAALLAEMAKDEYLTLPPPKSTGRERYGEDYVAWLTARARALSVNDVDLLATATRFTALCVREGVLRFPELAPQTLIVGGGGSRNDTLLSMLATELPGVRIITNESLGLDSDAKEAVAFAVLANETVCGLCGNALGATGAKRRVVLGKVSF